jgi:nucleotide-binding universal stress UspA family protein
MPRNQGPPAETVGFFFGTYLEKHSGRTEEGLVVFLKKILIPTDLSEYSLAAMEYGFTMGLLFGARLYMIYVGAHGSHKDPREAAAALDQFMARRVDGRLCPLPVVRVGQPADEITRFAAQEGMDLIVMATHGNAGLKHAFLGSVSEKVVRQSLVPVLTVRPPFARELLLQFRDVEKELHLL